MWLLIVASIVGACVAAIPLAYLFVLTLLSFAKPSAPSSPNLQLVALIPAHNEAAGIGATIGSLFSADYSSDNRSVVVVADNCTDATAANARSAGATVIERNNTQLRGKGYALQLGYAEILRDSGVDGVLVIDADTVVAANLWRVMSDRLSAGARVVQAANRVRNRDATWRTRLLAIALAMINGVRCLGRERLGLSVGLKGNGMAFSRRVLLEHPHQAFGVVEDVEQATSLGLAGVRVHFAPDTFIASESPESGAASVSQRKRWEGGRIELVRTMVPKLLAGAVHQRSALMLDLAVELLIPPLSYPALLLVVGAAIELALLVVRGAPSPAVWLWLACAVALVVHVLRGWSLSSTGLRGLLTLLASPAYVAWKLVVARPFGKATAWVRTTRVSEDRLSR